MRSARKLVIFDIDGTLADARHRLHYILYNASVTPSKKDFKPNWAKFYTQAFLDEPIMDTVAVLHNLQMFCDIKFFTGRRESIRNDTVKWLDTHLALVTIDLSMRVDGDHRPDYVIKQEMYEALSDHDRARLICVFEDRNQVVDMWRDNNVTCYQVCDGDY
jgi:FMN phosphatase YigB (HAD superfamily)